MHRHFKTFAFAALTLTAPLGAEIRFQHGGTEFHADEASSRYSFQVNGAEVMPADANAGILLDGKPLSLRQVRSTADTLWLEGKTSEGRHVGLKVTLNAHLADIEASVDNPGSELRFQTGGAAPAYGLADHAVYQPKNDTRVTKSAFDTDVTGFSDDDFLSGQGISRLVSNFVIYPRQHFAELLIDPSSKIVHTSGTQITQGVRHAPKTVHLYYFFGDPHSIYADYLHVRKAAGYRVEMPKYQAFGVGWEAFGALGWETNTKTVGDNVDRYLSEGYPLKWMVIGSGFWPAEPDTMHETTSFGLWDHAKYPEPKKLIAHFRDKGLSVMLGLRISFIVGGPYSEEGAKRGYFLTKEGKPEVFKGPWPKQPYYLLDAHNPAALNWYIDLVKKWKDYGINGWKEDFYGYGGFGLRDDKIDPTNDRLFAAGDLIIERNGYLSSNGDLHRINDFNFNQDQDRGPVNSLALAYSGFPFVYPDIVGGTFGENHFSTNRTAKMETYMMRNVQWAMLHASMGMGEPPWTFRKQVSDVMLQSARFHERIAPYLFSNARKATIDGYPWTMAPLTIAFPGDGNVYGRENSSVRGYEWMIGDAMLAAPLYGNDYETAGTRDIYLPEGKWIDYDSGKIYAGSQVLKSFALPAGKTPVFIGGSGVTIEHINGQDRVCVYPVEKASSVQLTLPDSDKVITVKVPALHSIANANVKAAGTAVSTTVEGHALTFVPKPGTTYVVGTR
jgi:alpha-glucosidase (family GH31 glycosyl hydrolase)